MVRGLAMALLACWLGGCAEAPPPREKQPWDPRPAAAPPPAAPGGPGAAPVAVPASPGLPSDPERPVLSPEAQQRIAGLSAACDGGKRGACLELGQAWLANARGVPRSPSRAAAALATGCRARDGAACRRLQDLFDGDDTTPSNLTAVYDAFSAACDARTWEGCIGLGLLHAEGVGVPTTLVKAAATFKRACDGGSPRGCHLYAILLEDGLGVEADLRRAMDLQEAACRQGHQPACVAHGVQLLVDEQSEAAAAIALAAFQGACRAGEQDGCLAHALVLRFGIGVEERYFEAAEIMTRSCLGGHAAACFQLGQAQPHGSYRPGAPLDGAAAYVRGCELRDAASCLFAGFALHEVEALVGLQGSERKPHRAGPEAGRARAFYERACMLRLGPGCLAAASMYQHGQPPPKDERRARAYQQLACRYGAGEGGCDAGRRPSLRRLPQKR